MVARSDPDQAVTIRGNGDDFFTGLDRRQLVEGAVSPDADVAIDVSHPHCALPVDVHIAYRFGQQFEPRFVIEHEPIEAGGRLYPDVFAMCRQIQNASRLVAGEVLVPERVVFGRNLDDADVLEHDKLAIAHYLDVQDTVRFVSERLDRVHDTRAVYSRDATTRIAYPDRIGLADVQGGQGVIGQPVGDRELIEILAVVTVEAPRGREPQVTRVVLLDVDDPGLGESVQHRVEAKWRFGRAICRKCRRHEQQRQHRQKTFSQRESRLHSGNSLESITY